MIAFEKYEAECVSVSSSSIPLDGVIPAWNAGIQDHTDVSGRILRTWMPAIHAGMTRSSFSCFVGGRRKIMNHFVVIILVNEARNAEYNSAKLLR
jgi:hypothetical protein